MTTYRPTFRVSPPTHGGGGASRVIPNSSRHHRLRTPSRQSPAMRLLTTSRDLNQTGRALASLNKMMEKETEVTTSQLPSHTRQDQLKRENFEDFNSRIMKASSDGVLTFGPEIQAAFLRMSSGISPSSGRRRLKQRLNGKSENLNITINEKSNGETQGQDQDKDGEENKNNIFVNSDKETHERPTPPMGQSAPFVSTFGNGVGRASLGDLEYFQKQNKLWKSTLKYFQQPTSTPSGRGSEQVVQNPTETTGRHHGTLKRHSQGHKDLVAANTAKIQASTDLNRILQRGSMLLMASAALKPKQTKSLKEKFANDVIGGSENDNLIEYSPPSKSFLDKAKDGALKFPIYDRIESKREKVLKEGFEFEKVEDEITNAVRNVAREMKHTFGMGSYTKTCPKITKPFDKIKISKLVGYNAATAQGYRQKQLEKQDIMNPLQLKLVQGLPEGELSSFLENQGRRQQVNGMQIIPGMAPDSGQQHMTFNSGLQRSIPGFATRRPYKDSETLIEPKFRTLPQNILNRVGVELSTVKKLSSSAMAGEVKGFPNHKFNSKMSPYVNKEPPMSPRVNKIKTTKTQNGLKTSNLKDMTKSEFIRDMRKHQGQIGAIKT